MFDVFGQDLISYAGVMRKFFSGMVKLLTPLSKKHENCSLHWAKSLNKIPILFM
jgi:hypothetical protein